MRIVSSSAAVAGALLHLLMQLFISYTGAGAAVHTEAGVCTRPGQMCNDPRGGQCVAASAKLSCECPDSATVVRNEWHSERICQTKLLDIHCRRDADEACRMVRESVCAPNEARCVCPQGFVFVPHRNQCKSIYRTEPQHQFCRSCQQEGGVCVKEDNVTQSNGPIRIEQGKTFRLSCACPNNTGVPVLGKDDTWTSPVCSTRLRDIEEICNDKDLLCRSKVATCRKPRDMETDMRKCQCPDRFVPVYQPWLKYYECFETRSRMSSSCSECASSSEHSFCYSATNQSDAACLCPKRMSSPVSPTTQKRAYCSKQHVSVSCNYNRMEVTFDPNYDEAPYNELPKRLKSGQSVAFIDSFHGDDGSGACELQRTSDGMYKVTLLPNSVSVCGMRAIRRVSYYKTEKDNEQMLKAKLLILWNKNFFSYPDIQVDVMCKVDASDAKNTLVNLSGRKPGASVANHQPPGSVTGVRLLLRVLSAADRLISEAEEGDLIKLDVVLQDFDGTYTGLLVQKCIVSNHSLHKIEQHQQQPKLQQQQQQHQRWRQQADGGSVQQTKLIGCGGKAESKSGFTAGFVSSQSTGTTHLQTSAFPAFPVGRQPRVYFTCTVRLCAKPQAAFCDKSVCSDSKEKMSKRSPDDGIQEVQQQVRILVNAKSWAKQAGNYSICQYSMCLSTSQVIIIILILLVLLALISALIIVVYRRRLLLEAHRLRVGLSEDDTPTETPVEAHSKSSSGHGGIVLGSARVGVGGGGGGGGGGGVGTPRLAIYSPHMHDTLDSGIGASMLTYSSVPYDRGGKEKQQQHNRSSGCHMTSLLDNRPDVCTCDRSLHSSYSITSSQV